MKTPTWFIAAAALALVAAAHSAGNTESSESKLARMLAGRTAGEPVSCIPSFKGTKFEVLEGLAMVYKSGDTIYVARPTNPESLGRDDVLVIDRLGSQVCNTDIVRTVDRTGGYFTGVVFLGKFVPYTKQK